MMHRAVEVVDEDRPGDAELVAEQPRRGELVLEAPVRAEVLAGMRLARVDEVPAVAGVPVRELVEQRTLCRAVRSGEGAELEHDAVRAPQLRQADALAVEQQQLPVRGTLAGVQHVREGAELVLVLTALDVDVEAVVVVGHAHQPGRDVVLSTELVTAPAGTGLAASRFCHRAASE